MMKAKPSLYRVALKGLDTMLIHISEIKEYNVLIQVTLVQDLIAFEVQGVECEYYFRFPTITLLVSGEYVKLGVGEFSDMRY